MFATIYNFAHNDFGETNLVKWAFCSKKVRRKGTIYVRILAWEQHQRHKWGNSMELNPDGSLLGANKHCVCFPHILVPHHRTNSQLTFSFQQFSMNLLEFESVLVLSVLPEHFLCSFCSGSLH